jgi:hypothetical protein
MTFIERLKNEFSRFFTDKAVIISVIEGLAGAVMDTGAIARVRELMLHGMPLSYAVRDWSPIHLNERP